MPANEEEPYQEEEVQRFNTHVSKANEEDDEMNQSRNINVEDMIVYQLYFIFIL